MLFTNSMLPEHCRSLFLGDLSCFCQEADVYRFFQPFGEIEEIRIKRNHDGIGLGYGFITFARRESAELAMRKDGEVLVGRPVR
jgi:RNA recognition motif-containing protein